MKKIILKINSQTSVIEDIAESYSSISNGYFETQMESYPNDIMCGCYKYIGGEIIKDEDLYSEFIKAQEEPRDAEEMKEALNILGVEV